MKFAAALLVVLALTVVGCAKKTQKAPATNGSVTDVNPNTSYNTAYTPTQAYTPAPAFTAPAPVEPTITSTPTPAVTATSGAYTVKKGDTLYSIAKTQYGDGKQWKKIVDANPGLDPAKLKVGQTIQLP